MVSATVKVYLRNSGGTVFTYEIKANTTEALTAKAREHAGQIMKDGYRHAPGDGTFEWFGSHWIDKIKVTAGVTTTYPDKAGGT